MGTTWVPPLDRATLADLYDRHGEAAYGLAYQITGRIDVAGAVTERVFTELARTTGIDDFERRLLSEVHRQSVAWMRQACAPAAHPALTTGDQASLAGLPVDERTAIANAYFAGRTYTEIAAGMQVGSGQVADLLRRGLERLAATSTLASGSTGRRRPGLRSG